MDCVTVAAHDTLRLHRKEEGEMSKRWCGSFEQGRAYLGDGPSGVAALPAPQVTGGGGGGGGYPRKRSLLIGL